MSLTFKLHKTEGFARRAEIHLNHGVVQTPVFMPVGTYGTVKAMSPLELNEIGTQILLGNTFHLWLRPGLEVIAEHGDLHGFMGWEKPDSDGLRRLPGLLSGQTAQNYRRRRAFCFSDQR